MNDLVKTDAQEIMEAVLIKGDLSKLTPQERNNYYSETCRSLGLNPLTRPFDYITLNGKMTLYAKRDCADQLRKLNGVNIEIVDKTIEGQLFAVTVRAKDRTGRQDEDMGVVVLPQGGSGEIRANAMLKAITKAKRRVTLSICGLGFLDETEIEDIPAEAKAPARHKPIRTITAAEKPAMAIEEAAVIDSVSSSVPTMKAAPSDASPSDRPHNVAATLSVEDMAREAAQRGRDVFEMFYKGCTREQQATLRGMKAELETLMPA